jgi:hypothetical protein
MQSAYSAYESAIADTDIGRLDDDSVSVRCCSCSEFICSEFSVVVIVVCYQFTESSEERLAVSSTGVGCDERLLESVAILSTALAVTGLTEVLELFALAIPAISVFVVFAGALAIERLAAGDAGHLLAGATPPQP